MKKSEFVAKRGQERRFNPPMEFDIECAEAAGVKWDPEELALPKRLEINQAGKAIVDPEIRDGDEIILVMAACYRGTSGTKESARIATELVRRYNALEQIESFAERASRGHCINGIQVGTEILTILKGEPHG